MNKPTVSDLDRKAQDIKDGTTTTIQEVKELLIATAMVELEKEDKISFSTNFTRITAFTLKFPDYPFNVVATACKALTKESQTLKFTAHNEQRAGKWVQVADKFYTTTTNYRD